MSVSSASSPRNSSSATYHTILKEYVDTTEPDATEPLLPSGDLIDDPINIDVGNEVFQVSIKLDHVSYTVNAGKKNEKVILDDVSCEFRPSEVVTLMGPSGSGKTTLMSVLLGDRSGRLDGSILANGSPIGRGFKNICNFVPQEDVLLSALTPRETLMYSAELRLPEGSSLAMRTLRVHEVLEMLSIDECADTRIGNVDVRGISGGQRKRVCIAQELLTFPSVLLLDEPTSGLDSKMAEDVVQILRSLGDLGHTVVCSIHQPSYKVLCMFDRLVMLHYGRPLYNGPISELEGYFDSLGHSAPLRENPMDFYMRLIQGEEGDELPRWVGEGEQQQQRQIKEEGENVFRGTGAEAEAEVEPETEGDIEDTARYPVRKRQQFQVLLRRSMYDAMKDPKKFVQGMGLKVAIGVLVGVVWIGQDDGTNQGIFPTTGAIFLLINSAIMDTLFGIVMVFPTSQALLRREYRNGHYSLPAYFWAEFLSRCCCEIIYSFFMSTPVYFMVGMRRDAGAFFAFAAVIALTTCLGVAVAFVLGPQCPDFQSAQQACMPTMVPLLLFAGYLIPYSQIPSVFRFLYWASFWQYSSSILQANEFKDIVFKDCTEFAASHGACFLTGRDYLKSVNINTGNIPLYIGIMILMYIALAFLGYFSQKKALGRKR